ncbi:MAG: carbon-nitrogen hydrolase, partial [Myxococcales bacterium]
MAQLAPALGDLERNLELHIEAVEAARADGVEVLFFPELSLTGYRLKDMVPEVAAERDGPVFEALAELSKGMSLVVGLVEETAQHFFYNSAVYFEDGKV